MAPQASSKVLFYKPHWTRYGVGSSAVCAVLLSAIPEAGIASYWCVPGLAARLVGEQDLYSIAIMDVATDVARCENVATQNTGRGKVAYPRPAKR